MRKEQSPIRKRTNYLGFRNAEDLKQFSNEEFVVFEINNDGTCGNIHAMIHGMYLIETLINAKSKTVVIPYDRYKDFKDEYGYTGFPSGIHDDPKFESNVNNYRAFLHFEPRSRVTDET